MRKWSHTSNIGREGLIVQPDRCGSKDKLSIEFRPSTGNSDLFSFAHYWTELSAEYWRQIDHAAVLKIETAYLAARPCTEGANTRRLRDRRKLGRRLRSYRRVSRS